MRSRRHLRILGLALGAAALVPGAARPARGLNFSCNGGDVTCLVNAIHLSNAAGGANVIDLGAGTYNLTTVDNTVSGREGPNGLPLITSFLTIQGAGASATIIQRAAGAPCFRIFDVWSVLALNSLTIQGGDVCSQFDQGLESWGGLGVLNFNAAILSDVVIRRMFLNAISGTGGAAIRNLASLSMTRTLIEENKIWVGNGCGILNEGTMTIERSTIRNNRVILSGAGAGVATGPGAAVITGSTISGNVAAGFGGGIYSRGGLTVKNSTFTGNNANSSATGGGGILADAGTTLLENCTIADNSAGVPGNGGGIFGDGGTVQLRNTILARNFRNTADEPPTVPQDCVGPITSLGHNIVGDTDGCTIALQASDSLGNPRLASFTDQIRAADGSPQGNGQFPLLIRSPAIDAGDTSVCGPKDQLGYPRVDANLNDTMTCDIGASEYAPPVNAWVTLVSSRTRRNPNPRPGAPAGTVTVTRQYLMTTDTVLYPAFVIRTLPAGVVLLNSDPPSPGGAGARLTPNVGSDSTWSPGELITVAFVFGLQRNIAVNFAADVVGYPHLP